MSVLTKQEFMSDLRCIEISLLSQCKALIQEGEIGAFEELLARSQGQRGTSEFDKLLKLKESWTSRNRF